MGGFDRPFFLFKVRSYILNIQTYLICIQLHVQYAEGINANAHVTSLMGLIAVEAADAGKRTVRVYFYLINRANACP